MRIAMKRAILAKIESAYGTDPTPTGASDAMYVYDPKITPMELVVAERNPARPFFGQDTSIVGGTPVKVEFSFPLAGGGAAGTAPGYGVIKRACGMSQTISAAVDVTYALVSSSFESMTLYANLDGVNHKVTGLRGSITEEFNHGEIPLAKFSGIGLYNAPTDTALPTLTFGATWAKPLIVNKVNTTPVTLHGTAIVMSKLSIQVANELSWKDYPNGTEEVRFTGRPKVTGSITIQADTVAAKDWFGIAKAGTTGAFTLTHGTAAGNKVKRDAATVQLFNPSYEEEDGVQMLKMDLGFFPTSAGNDEIVEKAL